MSFINGITGAVGALQTARSAPRSTLPAPGAQPSDSAVTGQFRSIFKTTFDQNMQTVFESASSGKYDDATIRLEQAVLASRIAEQQKQLEQGRGQLDLGSAVPTPSAVVDGDEVAGGGPAGASAAPEVSTTTLVDQSALHANQKALLELNVRSAEAILDNASKELRIDHPEGAKLVSSSSGTWDPATYVPKTKADSEIFADRMSIDVAEATLQLEILRNKVFLALFEVQTTGGAAALAELARVEELFGRQQAWVTKLAVITNSMSGNEIAEVGEQAITGDSVRTRPYESVDVMVADLRAAGYSEDEIMAAVGASELAIEEMSPDRAIAIMRDAGVSQAELVHSFGQEAVDNAAPGPHTGSARRERIAGNMREFAHEMFLRQSTVTDTWAQLEREHEEWRAAEDKEVEQAVERKYLERKTIDGLSIGRAAERRANDQALSQQAASRHSSEFQAMIAAIDQRAAESRNLRQAG